MVEHITFKWWLLFRFVNESYISKTSELNRKWIYDSKLLYTCYN